MTDHQGISQENINAAAKIFEEHGDFIYSVICYKLSDKSLADDIYQDFFLALSANPVSIEGPQLKAYLYKSIVHDILDAVRRVKYYRKNINKFSEYFNLKLQKSDLRNACTVEDKMVKIMRKAWKEIPPAQRKAISLKYIEGYSNAEIAEKMEINQGSVSNYLNRGLLKLREIMRNKTGVKNGD